MLYRNFIYLLPQLLSMYFFVPYLLYLTFLSWVRDIDLAPTCQHSLLIDHEPVANYARDLQCQSHRIRDFEVKICSFRLISALVVVRQSSGSVHCQWWRRWTHRRWRDFWCVYMLHASTILMFNCRPYPFHHWPRASSLVGTACSGLRPTNCDEWQPCSCGIHTYGAPLRSIDFDRCDPLP